MILKKCEECEEEYSSYESCHCKICVECVKRRIKLGNCITHILSDSMYGTLDRIRILHAYFDIIDGEVI